MTEIVIHWDLLCSDCSQMQLQFGDFHKTNGFCFEDYRRPTLLASSRVERQVQRGPSVPAFKLKTKGSYTLLKMVEIDFDELILWE